MNKDQETKCIIILCETNGIINNIINDEIKVEEKKCAGKDLSCILADESFGKALTFLKKVREKKAALNYEMPVKTRKGTQVLVFSGIMIYKKILIIAANTFYILNDLFEEMSKIINEQTNLIRSCEEGKARIANIERQRIEKDLHDSISQTIFSTRVIAEILPELWQRDQQEALKQLDRIKVLTAESSNEMRRVLLELRPDAFSEENIVELIKQLISSANLRSNIDVQFKVNGTGNPETKVKEAIYRVCQEALNNAIKHSSASMVKVILKFLPEKIYLGVEDNGRGFEVKKIPRNKYGLYIMHERAKVANSTLKINSNKGKGTKIIFNYKK